MNYVEANNKLTGRNKISRKLANHTYLIRLDDNSIAVKLHQTNVVTFYPDGKIILDSGNWHTQTTKDRINTYSGYRISQSNGRWYIFINNTEYVFNDGMIINPDGEVKNAGIDNLKADKKFKAQVKKFAELCANSIPITHPSAGDCWYCLMKGNDNKSLGDTFKDTEHLTSHMDEGYVVPSLVFNAMVEAGYNPQKNIQFSLVFDNPHNMIDLAHDCVKRSVYKYILKRFGYAV